jgi:type IV pilus assembly protein PilB
MADKTSTLTRVPTTQKNTDEARLGDLLVREGLATEAQVSAGLNAQAAGTSYVPLGQLLVKQKVLTQRQLDLALDIWKKRPKLGEMLLRHGAITRAQLTQALDQQKKTPAPLGKTLLQLGFLDDVTFRRALCVQLGIPFIDLDNLALHPDLVRAINRNYAKRHNLVPVATLDGSLTLCMDDPTDRKAVEELSRTSRVAISVVTASHESIVRAFARLYDPATAEAEPAETFEITIEDEDGARRSKYSEEYQSSKSADALVRRLLSMAIEHRASDIHVETLANGMQVRFRVDGVLEQLALGEFQLSSPQLAREVVSRFKILGKLDIAERRRPQDGSFRVKVSRRGPEGDVDLRLSIVPSHYGESVVIRVLDRHNAPTSIDQLQFPQAVSTKIRQLLSRPSGILLVTGPTGSGKTSTLYASLMTVYRPQIRVLTAEDPIEYIYDQFSQSEVDVRIGNTFASLLRAFLRHDPEVMMVGEIRDVETAEMAFRGAQTGHLLLSTLHTNSAVGTIPRLRDLQVDPNSLASSLIGVVGQRLVRQVCAACKVEDQPSADLINEFFDVPPMGVTFYKGRGCPRCNFSGYRGRVAIVELWAPSDHDIVLINKNAPFEDIRDSALKSTLSMADAAWIRLQEGRTTLEELVRVVPYSAIADFKRTHGSVGHLDEALEDFAAAV